MRHQCSWLIVQEIIQHLCSGRVGWQVTETNCKSVGKVFPGGERPVTALLDCLQGQQQLLVFTFARQLKQRFELCLRVDTAGGLQRHGPAPVRFCDVGLCFKRETGQ